MKRKLMLVGLVLLMAVPSVFADRRKYVWTYQTATIAPGDAELEFYQTTRLDDTDSWEYRIEIEHGISPRFDMSIYQIFAQREGEAFKWDAFQIRSRYRFGLPGEIPWDPVLYLEYRRKIDLKEQNKIEGKLLLSKDFEKTNIAINPVYEFFWAPGDPVHEFGMDLGISYAPSFKFAFGIESTSRYEILKNEDNEFGSYLGPTLSFASGSIYYTVGYAWGITDDSNDARARFLMGVGI